MIDKPNFKPKWLRRDKEDHYILKKEAIHHKQVTIINTYDALNVGMPSFINKHKWTKRDRGEQNNNR
jgi:hypothetical protein